MKAIKINIPPHHISRAFRNDSVLGLINHMKKVVKKNNVLLKKLYSQSQKLINVKNINSNKTAIKINKPEFLFILSFIN